MKNLKVVVFSFLCTAAVLSVTHAAPLKCTKKDDGSTECCKKTANGNECTIVREDV